MRAEPVDSRTVSWADGNGGHGEIHALTARALRRLLEHADPDAVIVFDDGDGQFHAVLGAGVNGAFEIVPLLGFKALQRVQAST